MTRKIAPLAYDIFNLGNSTPIDLLGLVRLIEQNLGKKAEIQWLPMQPGDVPITYADISKSKRLLGYDPQTPIAEAESPILKGRTR